jgi:hypothetical protein
MQSDSTKRPTEGPEFLHFFVVSSLLFQFAGFGFKGDDQRLESALRYDKTAPNSLTISFHSSTS